MVSGLWDRWLLSLAVFCCCITFLVLTCFDAISSGIDFWALHRLTSLFLSLDFDDVKHLLPLFILAN
jgi:hypothetical protein